MPLHPDTEAWLELRREWQDLLADAFKGEDSEGYQAELARRESEGEEEEAEAAGDLTYEEHGLPCRKSTADGDAFSDTSDSGLGTDPDDDEGEDGPGYTPAQYFLDVLGRYQEICNELTKDDLISDLTAAMRVTARRQLRDTIPLERQLATLESFSRTCRHRYATFSQHMRWWCGCLRNVEQSDQELRLLLSGNPVGLQRFEGDG